MNSLQTCISSQLPIPKNELEHICSKFNARNLSKGDFFTHSGQFCEELAFIQEGLLRMYNLADGNEVTLWIGAEHSFITSLSSFIFQTPGLWNIQAITEVHLQVISRKDHFALSEKFPKWLEFDNLILARSFSLLEQRMFSQLHMNSQQRFEKLLAECPELFNRVPLQYLASMLGITPETLSRLRSKARA